MLFIDTSDIEALTRFKKWGVCSGVTTNPLILRAELGEGESVATRIQAVLAAHSGPVSVQLTELGSVSGALKEAEELQKISTRIVVKVPFTENGLQVMRELRGPTRSQIMPTNATGIMTFEQAYLAARAGAGFVSIFWNRIRDAGGDPHFVVRRTREVFDRQRIGVQIIAGSIRMPNDVSEALKAGAHIVTVPPPILEKMLWHPQTDSFLASCDTASAALALDAERLKKTG